MSVFFDKTLHYLGRKGFKPNILVIGAMDGHSFDDMTGYFTVYRWSGLFIEPIPYQFDRLVKFHNNLDYAHVCKYENCAIGEVNGTVQMLTIDTRAIEDGLIHPCFGGMSAIYPPKNGLSGDGDAETVAKYGKLIDVPCKTLQTVLDKHNIRHLDVIQVDTEGWDWHILKQLDLTIYKPKLIRAEIINLDDNERNEMLSHISSYGYTYMIEGQNVDFVDTVFWDKIH